MYKYSTIINQPFTPAQQTLFEAFEAAGLSRVSDIDMQTTLHNKLGKKMRPYHIYGACSAPLAERIIDAEPDAGVLLPCTVILRETADNQCVVSFMNPVVVFGLAENPVIDEVSRQAEEKIRRAVEFLTENAA